MTDSLPTQLRRALDWDQERDALAIVKAAEASVAEFTNKGPHTVENSPEEMHEFGFYAGAKYQRDGLGPLHERLIKCVEALLSARNHTGWVTAQDNLKNAHNCAHTANEIMDNALRELREELGGG